MLFPVSDCTNWRGNSTQTTHIPTNMTTLSTSISRNIINIMRMHKLIMRPSTLSPKNLVEVAPADRFDCSP